MSVALAVVVRQAMGCIAARRPRSLQAFTPVSRTNESWGIGAS